MGRQSGIARGCRLAEATPVLVPYLVRLLVSIYCLKMHPLGQLQIPVSTAANMVFALKNTHETLRNTRATRENTVHVDP
jgi:spore maturation protein SpmB